jgi:ribonuclease HII
MAISVQEKKRLEVMKLWEKKSWSRGYQHVAGVDEAGRGPLAGPVVAAACVLPQEALIEGINDSKKLTPEERFQIFEQLLTLPGIDYGIGVIDVLIIDQINILQATFQAMIAAIARLARQPDYLLVDGNKLPPTPIPGDAIVEGDSLSQSIAAASILAKVTRDRLMMTFHQKWPEYGFESNKGYATEAHMEAIKKHGYCPIHRLSFEPLKSLVKKEEQLNLF